MNNFEIKYYNYASIPLENLKPFIENYASPVFLYSRKSVTESFNQLRDILPPKFKIFYAQKSNPNSKILKHINGLGAGCDTASLGEMKSALAAGFAPAKIMLTGPSKSNEEISFAVDNNILSVNVESVQELNLVNKIAREKNKIQNILVRINPPYDSSETTRIIGGTGVSKFGIDIEQIETFFNALKSCGNVSLTGIHIFNSSQILDAEKILSNTKNVIDTAMDLSTTYSFKVNTIDLGGGFGIPFSDSETPINLKKLAEGLNSLVSDKKHYRFLDGVDLIFEPGRYLSGRAGMYLVKVLYTKNSRGTEILLADGGIHHLLRPVLIGQSHPAVNLTALLEGRKGNKKYMIAGPLCTSIDSFGENIELADTKQGDIIAFFNAGAYGYTESMPLFLSHAPAKEIFID